MSSKAALCALLGVLAAAAAAAAAEGPNVPATAEGLRHDYDRRYFYPDHDNYDRHHNRDYNGPGDNYHQEGPYDYYGGYDPTPPGLLSIGGQYALITTTNLLNRDNNGDRAAIDIFGTYFGSAAALTFNNTPVEPYVLAEQRFNIVNNTVTSFNFKTLPGGDRRGDSGDKVVTLECKVKLGRSTTEAAGSMAITQAVRRRELVTIPSDDTLGNNLCDFYGYVNGSIVFELGGRLSVTVSPLPGGPEPMEALIDQGLVSRPQGEFDLKLTCTFPNANATNAERREAVMPLTGNLERENMILRASAAGHVPQEKTPKTGA